MDKYSLHTFIFLQKLRGLDGTENLEPVTPTKKNIFLECKLNLSTGSTYAVKPTLSYDHITQ